MALPVELYMLTFDEWFMPVWELHFVWHSQMLWTYFTVQTDVIKLKYLIVQVVEMMD